MGVLDDVLQHVASQTGGDPTHSAMAGAVVSMLTQQGSGGLPSLVQSFQSQGLGDVMSSWIASGPNQTIAPDQVHAALGADRVAQLAQQVGVSPQVAQATLAIVLPLLIDKMTSSGSLPRQSVLGEGLDILKKFM
jgi:uncharacterized protein YidB (DUF937 family)